MKQFFKAGAALVLLALAGSLAGGLYAQDNPAADADGAFGNYLQPRSNTKNATGGRFSTDVDNYMDSSRWMNLGDFKGFGFLGYGGTASNGNTPLAAGFAAKIGKSAYLGLYYTGNVVDKADPTYSTDVEKTNIIKENGKYVWDTVTTEKVEGSSADDVYDKSANAFYALIGVKNMGFKVGVYENLKNSKKFQPDIHADYISKVTEYASGARDSDKYDDLSYISGNISPMFNWAAAFASASGKIFRPYFDAIVNFSKNKTKYKETVLNTDALGNETANTVTDYDSDNGYINPAFKIGFEYDLWKGSNGKTLTSDLKYQIGFNVYGDDYGTSTHTVSPFNSSNPYSLSTTSTDTDEHTGDKIEKNLGHYIEPAVKFISPLGDKFVVSSKVGLGFGIQGYKTSNNDKKTVVTTTYIGENNPDNKTVTEVTEGNASSQDTEYSAFNLKPYIEVGGQYKATGRLILNPLDKTI